MNEVDREALRRFHEGSSSEARAGLRHLLGNALTPLKGHVDMLGEFPSMQPEIMPRLQRAVKRVVDLERTLSDKSGGFSV